MDFYFCIALLLKKLSIYILRGFNSQGVLFFTFATRWTSLQMKFVTTVSLRKKVRFLYILITIFSMRSRQLKEKKIRLLLKLDLNGQKYFFLLCKANWELF